ncbi:hypothetical protein D210916BOD24_04780 [Alteromonas sp. D210916BOD_24]
MILSLRIDDDLPSINKVTPSTPNTKLAVHLKETLLFSKTNSRAAAKSGALAMDTIVPMATPDMRIEE